MSTKNPFEIRTEVLSMAKDYMDKQHQLNMEFAQKAFDEAVNAGRVHAGFWKDYIPTMYSMEDLMEKAKEMYKFVETK